MPDLHKLNPYKLHFINKEIKEYRKTMVLIILTYCIIFKQLRKKLWNKYNDPHPNDYANT